jgi:ubiquitin-small subunit ribosomal protein S27Ae
MAKKGGAKKDNKGKKEAVKVKKEGKKLSALYNVSGDAIERKNRTCPKCGPGIFLGKHKDRLVCGKCFYVEFMSKEKPAEEAKPEEAAESKEEPKKE